MKNPVSVFCLLVLMLGCADKNSYSNVSAPETDYEKIKRIEQEAASNGVVIRQETGKSEYSYSYKESYFPLSVSWGGLGYTDAEMKTAVEILRKYYVAVSDTSTISKSWERALQLETIESAMTAIQAKRNDLLTKKICEK